MVGRKLVAITTLETNIRKKDQVGEDLVLLSCTPDVRTGTQCEALSSLEFAASSSCGKWFSTASETR